MYTCAEQMENQQIYMKLGEVVVATFSTFAIRFVVFALFFSLPSFPFAGMRLVFVLCIVFGWQHLATVHFRYALRVSMWKLLGIFCSVPLTLPLRSMWNRRLYNVQTRTNNIIERVLGTISTFSTSSCECNVRQSYGQAMVLETAKGNGADLQRCNNIFGTRTSACEYAGFAEIVKIYRYTIKLNVCWFYCFVFARNGSGSNCSIFPLFMPCRIDASLTKQIIFAIQPSALRLRATTSHQMIAEGNCAKTALLYT